ncbi:hypothetical protein [Streptomyces tibetensis]|uniref:hypothetical protein n=1 Tax=Streptomyces tibetensis TaxID=2382123 RepID=UPI0033D42D28
MPPGDRGLAKLRELRETLVGLDRPGPPDQATAVAVAEVMGQLWEFCRAVSEPEVVHAIETAAEYPALRSTLSAHWSAQLSRDETRTSRRVLADAGRTGLRDVSMLAVEGYQGVADELRLLGGRSAERAAVIGCGPYPETLMALQASGLVRRLVVGIDRHEPSAVLAEAVTARFCDAGCGVGIDRSDATAVDYAPYDLLVVANGLRGKARLLDRIRRTAPPAVRVLIRLPLLMGRLLYEDVERDLRPGWTVTARHRATPLSETLLLERSAGTSPLIGFEQRGARGAEPWSPSGGSGRARTAQ